MNNRKYPSLHYRVKIVRKTPEVVMKSGRVRDSHAFWKDFPVAYLKEKNLTVGDAVREYMQGRFPNVEYFIRYTVLCE